MVFQDPMSSLDPRQSVESLLVEGMRAHGLDTDGPVDEEAAARAARGRRACPRRRSRSTRTSSPAASASASASPARSRSSPSSSSPTSRSSALDVSVQAQVINLLEELQDEFDLTYLVIAHDLAVVRHISDRIGVMYLGGLVEEATADDLYAAAAPPVHPRPALRRARAGPDGRGHPGADPAHRRPPVALATLRPDAGSTPAAPGARRPGATTSDRRCAPSTSPGCPPATASPATGRSRSSGARSGRTRSPR